MCGRCQRESLIHTISPIFDEDSKILILGTFPSAASRGQGFPYGHPQNRFWQLIAKLMRAAAVPETIEEKRSFLLQNKIALWDVIERCDIVGSSDSSIRNVVPNDIAGLLKNAKSIGAIYANGASAARLYERYSYPSTGVPIRRLPSTSPANASYSLERLIKEWSVILERL
ncbi:MAG: DNA-deoxyinosine glycosylase [Bacillota bacterium]